LVIALILLSAGCARILVSVNSFTGQKGITSRRYVLKPGMEGISDTDLQFQEFCKYIDTVLSEKGYTKSDNPESADMAILVQYGIGDRETLPYTYSSPIYGKTGGGTSNINASTRDAFGNYTYTTGTVSRPEQYGVVGSELNTKYATTYLRYLKLDAVDYREYKATQKIVFAWQTEIKSRGNYDDLRTVFPYLIVAAAPYLGEDTGKQISIKLKKTDDRVQKLKFDALSRK
jgi:hypothetical protein